jgi:hypothetical protein
MPFDLATLGILKMAWISVRKQNGHSKEDEKRERLEEALEEGLRETFPASDAFPWFSLPRLRHGDTVNDPTAVICGKGA